MTLLFTLKSTPKLQKLWLPTLSSVRNGAYPAWYLNAIPKEELAKLEPVEMEKLNVMPVKPAPFDMTNSFFDNEDFKKFINMSMEWANKEFQRELMRGVFAKIKRVQLAKYHAAPPEEKASIETNPMTIFLTAVENCKPVLTVIPIKKGGITYQVPFPITANKSRFMAMKWLITAGKDKEGPINFIDNMSKELLDAYYKEGRVIKRKQDLHKLCENNKAYAHYRWS
ncbi:hypothetical protein JTE90_021766 [Oedothorax gibbosus]|uniref:Small ribosomal subunit protein uS7 domain-containing protein n=1 Tax=Oedothorax gibbosus TaxID=931172 RepID=A0AAV6TP27_9ARAC|nr:hypothetical protein JTE90_021766 [Oedothorax gibbosus]